MQWNGNEWEGVDTPPAAGTPAKPESRVKRIASAALEASLITALTFGLIAGSAFAAKGGGGASTGGGRHGGGGTTGGGTIALAPLVVDSNGNGTPNWGDSVTFNVSTTATATPFVNLVCSQNGVEVSSGWKGFWDGSIDVNWNFGLSSPMWHSGAADCVAWLDMQTKQGWQRLASTSFHVDA
jgi:hypothetical protein